MSTYGKGTNCDKLWRAWHGILICVLHVFLIYVGIVRYLSFKYEAFDPKFGGDWDQSGLNFTLAMLISAIALFSLFLFVNLTRTANYANEGVQIGRDTNNLNLLSSIQSWRPSIPMMTIKGNGFQRPVTQMLSNGESEDDRMSTMGEEDALPGPNFDTWSGRSLPNQDHPYAAVGTARYSQSVTQTSMRTSLHILCNRLQRHMLPYSGVLHLTAAFCFILPISIMHAQQISHRALPSGWIWHSDLDIFFGSHSMDSKLQNNELLTTIDNTASNKPSSPATDELINPSTWDNLRAVSPEFFNLALALMLLSFRYPSVFWYTNRAFSFIFSVLLFLTGIHALIDYCAASVLVKLALNSHSLPGWAHLRLVCISAQHTQNKGSDSSVQLYSDSKLTTKAKANPNILSCIAPLVLSTTGTLLFLFLFLTVFEYGYRQFSENLSTYRHYLIGSPSHANGFQVSNGDADPYGQITDSNDTRANGLQPNGPTVVYTQSDSIHSGPNGSGKLLNPCHGVSSTRKRKYTLGAELLHPACRCCLYIYAPHIVGLIGSLCVLIFKLPLIWDYLQVYRLTRHALMLAAPLSGIIALCAWFIVWFAFSLKPAWKFLVNLPLQTMPSPAVLPPPTMLMQSNPNGMVGGPMMGSLLRPSSLGIHGDGNSRLGTVMLSSQAGTLHPHLAPLLSTPLSTNCYGPDEGSITQVGVQPSPIYACFHDPTGMGYAGTSVNALPRFIRLGNSREVGVTAANVNGLPTTLIVSGARNAEYDGEDAEVSSGRQSGSNYVCLQSALGSNGTGQVPIHGGVFASSATGGLVTRLLQPTTSECISPSPSQLRALESNAPTNFATQLPLSNEQSRSTLDVGTVLSSPSEEDDGSTHTVQYLTNKLRSNGMHPSSVCPNSSTGPYSMLNIGKLSSTPRSPFTGDTQSTDMTQTANTYSREGSVRLSSASMSFGTTNNARQNLTNFRSTLNPTNTPGSGALTPRVTFREKVDMISHVSPTSSAVGSPNHSSNDSGIDNVKIDNRSQTSILPFSPPSDGSGTYDNTFPASFCSGLVIRNPGQSNGEVDGIEGSGTLQRSVGNVVTTINHPMNGSVYNDRHSKFTNQLHSNSASLSPTEPSNESTGLCTSVSINPSVHATRTNEMIGDANNSFQSSNAEPFPLLFSSSLIAEQTQEPRLCSQV